MALKVRYCSDGNLHWRPWKRRYIRISCHIESHQPGLIKGLFRDIDLNVTYSSNNIRIPSRPTEKFLKFIGDPILGMEYLWEVQDEERYYQLKP